MIRLGIIGAADIAFRRFMPAIKDNDEIQVVAISEEYSKDKLENFISEYSSLEAMNSHSDLIARDDIDALYIPQPPAMHFKWAKLALEAGKHVLVEKPSTTSLADSEELVRIAGEKGLALHENYMFRYHSQIASIMKMVEEGMIGDARLYRASFGFPMREKNDFRYSKSLGGGALFDAGGYPLRLAAVILGNTAKVDAAALGYSNDFDVDIYGSAQLSNDKGDAFQLSFGMDCAYKCELEIWGSKGTIYTNRIFTAPDGFEPEVKLVTASEEKNIHLEADNHFTKSINAFAKEIKDESARERMYNDILIQADLISQVAKKANRE